MKFDGDFPDHDDAAGFLAINIADARLNPVTGEWDSDDGEDAIILRDLLVAVCQVAVLCQNILEELRAARQASE
jgi:hypothetical protein